MSIINLFLATGSLAFIILSSKLFLVNLLIVGKQTKLSQTSLGLTLGAIGTSLPELFISITGFEKGLNDTVIGNIIGSNISNLGIGLGISIVILPYVVLSGTHTREKYVMLASTFALIAISLVFQQINWIMGAIFLVVGIYHLIKSIEPAEAEMVDTDSKPISVSRLILAVILLVAASGGMWLGSNGVINYGLKLIENLGIEYNFFTIFFTGLGTSLPEITNCIIFALSGAGAISFGQIIGSNIFNVLVIIGISGMYGNIPFAYSDWSLDLIALGAITLGYVVTTRKTVFRLHGVMLLISALLYTAIKVYFAL